MLPPELLYHIFSFLPKHLELRSVCQEWNAHACNLHSASLTICKSSCRCLVSSGSILDLQQALVRLPWITQYVYKCNNSRSLVDLQSELQQHIMCLLSFFGASKRLIIQLEHQNEYLVMQFANWCHEVSSPQLSISLDLINSLTFGSNSQFKRFFESPGMAAIQSLNLGFIQFSDDDDGDDLMSSSALHSFFASKTISNLSKLQFLHCFLFDLGTCTAFASSPYLTRLTHLSLVHSELKGADDNDQSACYKILLTAPSLSSLASLSIRYDSSLPVDALEALGTCPLRTSLRTLDLEGSNVTGTGLYHLLTAPYLTNLKELNLNNYKSDIFYDYEVFRVMADPALFTLTSLQALKIEGTFSSIRKAGLVGLLKSSIVSSVTHLSLASNSLDDECLSAMCSSSYLRRLEEVNIKDNPVTIDGLLLFLSSAPSSLPNLQTVHVHSMDSLASKWNLNPSSAKIALKFT